MTNPFQLLQRFFWGQSGTHTTSTAATAPLALVDQVAQLQRALAEQRAADDLRVMYCPRCGQNLPAKVFAGHKATLYARQDCWPGFANGGFTSETIEYMGAPIPCPGGFMGTTSPPHPVE